MAKSNSLLKRIPWEEAYMAFIALDQKRQWIIGMGGAVVLLILMLLPVSCATGKLGKLETEYLNSQKNLTQLARKVQEYNALKTQKELLDETLKKTKGGSLATIMEGLASEAGIAKNVNSLKPRKISSSDEYEEQGLDVQLQKVSLQSAMTYLEKIQTSTKIRMTVSKLQIKPKSGNRAELDVTFQASTLIPKEATK